MPAHRNGTSSSAPNGNGASPSASSSDSAGSVVAAAEPARTCATCGQPLDGRPGQTRYCGPACFNAARAARARADRAVAAAAATSQPRRRARTRADRAATSRPRRRARTQKPAQVHAELAQAAQLEPAGVLVEREPSTSAGAAKGDRASPLVAERLAKTNLGNTTLGNTTPAQPAPAGVEHQAGTLGILCEHAIVAVAARTIRGATFDTGDGISVTVAARW